MQGFPCFESMRGIMRRSKSWTLPYSIVVSVVFHFFTGVDCVEDYRTFDFVDGVSGKISDKNFIQGGFSLPQAQFASRAGSLDIQSHYWSKTHQDEYPEESEDFYSVAAPTEGEYSAQQETVDTEQPHVTIDRADSEHTVTINMPRMEGTNGGRNHVIKKFVIQPVIQYVVQYDKDSQRDSEDGSGSQIDDYERGQQSQDNVRSGSEENVSRYFDNVDTKFESYWGNDETNGNQGGNGGSNGGGDSNFDYGSNTNNDDYTSNNNGDQQGPGFGASFSLEYPSNNGGQSNGNGGGMSLSNAMQMSNAQGMQMQEQGGMSNNGGQMGMSGGSSSAGMTNSMNMNPGGMMMQQMGMSVPPQMPMNGINPSTRYGIPGMMPGQPLGPTNPQTMMMMQQPMQMMPTPPPMQMMPTPPPMQMMPMPPPTQMMPTPPPMQMMPTPPPMQMMPTQPPMQMMQKPEPMPMQQMMNQMTLQMSAMMNQPPSYGPPPPSSYGPSLMLMPQPPPVHSQPPPPMYPNPVMPPAPTTTQQVVAEVQTSTSQTPNPGPGPSYGPASEPPPSYGPPAVGDDSNKGKKPRPKGRRKGIFSSLANLPKLPASIGGHLHFMFSSGIGKGKRGRGWGKPGEDPKATSRSSQIDREQVSDHILNILGLTVNQPSGHSLNNNASLRTINPILMREQQGNETSLTHLSHPSNNTLNPGSTQDDYTLTSLDEEDREAASTSHVITVDGSNGINETVLPTSTESPIFDGNLTTPSILTMSTESPILEETSTLIISDSDTTTISTIQPTTTIPSMTSVTVAQTDLAEEEEPRNGSLSNLLKLLNASSSSMNPTPYPYIIDFETLQKPPTSPIIRAISLSILPTLPPQSVFSHVITPQPFTLPPPYTTPYDPVQEYINENLSNNLLPLEENYNPTLPNYRPRIQAFYAEQELTTPVKVKFDPLIYDALQAAFQPYSKIFGSIKRKRSWFLPSFIDVRSRSYFPISNSTVGENDSKVVPTFA